MLKNLYIDMSVSSSSLPPPSRDLAAAVAVLYIEDNPTNARLLAQYFARHCRATLTIADTAELGLTLAAQQLPDLILLDLQLPRISGLEVLRRLRAAPSTAAIPIVAISADAMPDHIQAARAAGFDDYLTKPIDFPVFARVLTRYGAGAAAD